MTGQLFLLLQENYTRELQNLRYLQQESRHTPSESSDESEKLSSPVVEECYNALANAQRESEDQSRNILQQSFAESS